MLYYFSLAAFPVVRVKQERPDEAEIRELAAKMVEANKAKMAAQPMGPNRAQGPIVAPGQPGIMGFFNRPTSKTPSTPEKKAPEAPAIDEQSQRGDSLMLHT